MNIRTLHAEESALLQELFLTMTREIPTAYAGSLAELEAHDDAYWQSFAELLATSPNMDGFVVEQVDGRGATSVCGFATALIQTERRLAGFEGRAPVGDGSTFTDTTMIGRMWIAPQVRGQGLAQTLLHTIIAWARAKQQRRVLLAVTEGNARAIRAYSRANFTFTAHTMPHPTYPELQIHFMEYML